MCSDMTLEYWRLAVDAMIFKILARIQCRVLMLISFLLKSKWNIIDKCPASDLKYSRAYVMDVEDKDDIP